MLDLRMFRTQVIFRVVARIGLLSTHLKPCLYNGSCPTPTEGLRTMLPFWFWVLLFNILLATWVRLGPYAEVIVELDGRQAIQLWAPHSGV